MNRLSLQLALLTSPSKLNYVPDQEKQNLPAIALSLRNIKRFNRHVSGLFLATNSISYKIPTHYFL